MNSTVKYILDKMLNRDTLMFIGAVLFFLLFFRQCNQIESLKREVKSAEQVADRNFNNYKAAQDSLFFERNKNDELVSSARSFELEVNSLTRKNSDLLKKYQKQLAINEEITNINSLISADLQIKDSIINATATVFQNQDTITVAINEQKEWDKYNWRRFDGSLNFYNGDSTFNVLSTNFNFYQGVSLTAALLETEDGTRLKISSPYPNLEFTRIENINLVNDELNRPLVNKSGWSIGFGVGYGLNLTPNQVITLGPSFGVGLYWSPKWLRF